MYEEESIIDGVLHWRGSPNGEWEPRTLKQLTDRTQSLERLLKRCRDVMECNDHVNYQDIFGLKE